MLVCTRVCVCMCECVYVCVCVCVHMCVCVCVVYGCCSDLPVGCEQLLACLTAYASVGSRYDRISKRHSTLMKERMWELTATTTLTQSSVTTIRYVGGGCGVQLMIWWVWRTAHDMVGVVYSS